MALDRAEGIVRTAWLMITLVLAGCASEPPSETQTSGGLGDEPPKIKVLHGDQAPVSTEAFVFEQRFAEASTAVVERFLVDGSGALSLVSWFEASSGSLDARLVDPSGDVHPLSFAPDGARGASRVAAENGEWRLEVTLVGWSGLVHVSVTPE